MHRALLAALVEDDDLHVAAHDDHAAWSESRDDVAVADLDRALEVRFEERLVDHLRRAADVEGAHGELRARLADRLRGDDADRLAHIDRRAAGEIAAVALAADAVLGLAGQHRADLHRLDAGRLDRLDVAALRSACPPATMTSPVAGSMTSSAAVRPRMREPSEATTWPASTIGLHGEAVRRCRNPPR